MDSVGSEEKQVETLSAGTLIAGRYAIESLLGIGAMGCVYLAKDHVLGEEHVAIKILHSEFAYSPTYAQRFLREVQLMRRLTHENIVRTYDVGADKDLVYFTMEFVQGKSLDKVIDTKKFSTDEVSDLILQVCRGLEAIHAVNVIHRDLKPANIILTDAGGIKITDFGVARPEFSKLTNHNEVVGSAGYMAPEVWLGKKATPAVDLYSFGVVLYELVTGAIPFDADSPGALMRLHLDRQPTPLKNLKPDAPLWLNKLVTRLLAKTPQERPRSAREVIDYVQANIQQQSPLPIVAGEEIKSAVEESSSLLAKLEELSRNATETGQLPDRSGMSGQHRSQTAGASSATRQIISTIIEFSRSSGTQVLERVGPLVSRHLQCVASTLCVLLALLCVVSYWATRFAGAEDPIFLALTQGVALPEDLASITKSHAARIIAAVFLLYAVVLATPIALAVSAGGKMRVALRSLRFSIPLLLALQSALLGWYLFRTGEQDIPYLLQSALAVRNNITEMLLLNPSITSNENPLVISTLYSDALLLGVYLCCLLLTVRIVTRGIHRAVGGLTTRTGAVVTVFALVILGESAIVTNANRAASEGLVSFQVLTLQAVFSLPALGWAVFNWIVAIATVIYLVVQATLDRRANDT